MKLIRTLLASMLFTTVTALAQAPTPCPATATVPYVEPMTGTAFNGCWTSVVGPAGSVAASQVDGTAAVASGYLGVESFTGVQMLTTTQGIQAFITYTPGVYPALALDQDATGGSISLVPSANGIFNMVGNSGGSPGGPLCTGTLPVNSGDTFLLTKLGSLYTATDVTTGKVVCSANSTAHSGVPGVQVDNRTGTSTIGPVTITGQALVVPPVTTSAPTTGEPYVSIVVPTAPDTVYTIGLTGFNFIPGVSGGTWTFSCGAPVVTQ